MRVGVSVRVGIGGDGVRVDGWERDSSKFKIQGSKFKVEHKTFFFEF
jgi:hypothetical protein